MIKRGEHLALSFKVFVKDYFQRSDDPHYYLVHILSSDENAFFSEDVSPTSYLAKESIREKVEE